MRPLHILLATAVAAIWGFNFVVIDVGIDAFPPLLFAALRFVVAAFPAILFVGKPTVAWRWIILIGLTIGTGQFALLFVGMHLGMPAGMASLVLQSQALFTGAIAVAALGERIGVRQAAGMLIAFGGIAAVGMDLGAAGPAIGFALCLGAAAMWAVGNVAMRKAQPNDTLNLMVWISVVPPLPLLGLSLLIEGPRADLAALANLSWAGVGALAYIAWLSTLLGFGIWGWLLRRYDAGTVAMYSLLVPVFGMSSAALALGERLTLVRVLAAVAVIAGVALSTLRGRARRADVSDPAPAGAEDDRAPGTERLSPVPAPAQAA